MQGQYALQAEAARRNEEDARLRLMHIDLSAARERVATLERTLEHERGLRDEQRKAEDAQRENAFQAELAAAMSAMQSLEQQRTLADRLQIMSQKPSAYSHAAVVDVSKALLSPATQPSLSSSSPSLASQVANRSSTSDLLRQGKGVELGVQQIQETALLTALSDAARLTQLQVQGLQQEQDQEQERQRQLVQQQV